MSSEALLKQAHDRLADSRQRGSWPRGRADSVHHLVGPGIDEHLEELLASFRVVRQRSVREAESGVIIQTPDGVEDTALFKDQNPRAVSRCT